MNPDAQRADSHHTLTLLFDDKIFLAPIGDDPKKVLDVGCGTGKASRPFAFTILDLADSQPNP